ncbi:MAG: hypothetical protein JWM74_2561 [Myxococcaceae bacterium]|nr:hypothetical protein [Myxococcaceae bacterium]
MAVLVSCLLTACASNDGGSEADEGSSEDAVVTASCAGAACPSLAQPAPLVRGGLATVGDELYWIGVGSSKDASGNAYDELQHCTLPSCSTITRLPLIVPGAELFWAHHLESIGSAGVLFETSQLGESHTRLYVSDGSTFHQVFASSTAHAVDGNGLLVYEKDRRRDGWAASKLSYCAFNGLELAQPCVTYRHESLNDLGSIALTPTHAVIVQGWGVMALDRGTLKGSTVLPVATREGNANVSTIGEFVFGMELHVYERSGQTFHDTSLFGGKDGFGGTIDGALDSFISSGSRGYVTTRGEGDVWERPHTGVVARINPTANVRFTRNLATEQDGYALALSSTDVYWLNRIGAPSPAAAAVSVVRHTKK